MKTRLLLFYILLSNFYTAIGQNVGIGTTVPEGKLHIKGTADVSQLIIDANSNGVQSNNKPLIRLRNSGQDLLWLNSDNGNNVFVGVNTGRSNDPYFGDNFNSFIGYSSGYSNTTGGFNTATGSYSLYSNTTGSYNTASGMYSLYSNTFGIFNTAHGNETLRFNTGSNNTATGARALYSNTSGGGNTANGDYALYSNTSGFFNTALGHHSLYLNTAGANNTAVGYFALNATTASQFNTAIGYRAGTNYDMGYNNTILGANCDINQNGLFNCIAIGQAVTNTASSQARIGNAATNSIGGYANWSNISDGRFKKDITDNVKGIDFIMKLKPVTYHLDVSGISKILDESRNLEMDQFSKQAIAEKEKIVYSGFVAQEVEKAAQETGYNFSGVDKPKNDKDFYGLRYAEFVVPLVKALQEQQLQITEQQKQMDALKKANDELKSQMIALRKLIESKK